jgi:demethylspheroidene O-methyltransferase
MASAGAMSWWQSQWLRQWHRPLALRDKLLTSPDFQRWASDFPLTQWIARRRAKGLFDLVAGFVYSQVLLACVRLNLFDILHETPQSLAALSSRLSLKPDATERLLNAAIALQLVERRGESYALGSLGAPMVGNTAIAAMVEHHAALYADLRDPVALLRGELSNKALSEYWPYTAYEDLQAVDTQRAAKYSALMSASQPLIAQDILDAYPMQHHKNILDIGGGEGTFLCSVGARHAHLRLGLFDLPVVAQRAQAKFAAHNLQDRAQVFGGSFLHDDLPQGHDLISLVRVLFDHPDEQVLKLLAAVRLALPPQGTLIVAEPMAGAKGAETMGDAYFNFYLMAMGHGRSRTQEQIKILLQKSGFTRIKTVPTRMPLQVQMISASH